MAASNSTVANIVLVLKKHVDEPTLKLILDDLSKIDGNQSFKDTIEKLRQETA